MDMQGAKVVLDRIVNQWRTLSDLQEASEVLLASLGQYEGLKANIEATNTRLAELAARAERQTRTLDDEQRAGQARVKTLMDEATATAQAIVNRAASEAGAAQAEIVRKQEQIDGLERAYLARKADLEADLAAHAARLAALVAEEDAVRTRLQKVLG